MTNIHDSGYKILFSNRTVFRQLMETFVKQPWVAQVDFDRAERVDKSFVSKHYKETESDLIYRLPWGEDELYVYVLLEFQSTVDDWMALRMLNYITNFYMALVDDKKVKKLPPIFPLVLYNGDKRWHAATSMAELIEAEPALDDYAIGFRYFKLVANEFSQEQLVGIGNIVSTLFFAESRPDIELLSEQFMALFEQGEDKQAISIFFNWFEQLAHHKRFSAEDFASLTEIYQSAEEVKSMLQKTFEEWYQQGRQAGIERGLEEGREEGREEGARRRTLEIVSAMRARGIDPALIADVTGLSMDELAELLAPPSSQDDTN
ncbi:MAG: Rpn family recombination-promoting nuclease/putative transposase [Caldilineaceae bacterium]